MLIYRRTSILESPAQTLVNTVNCVGVMGKGLAHAFKEREPEMFKAYKRICDQHGLEPGKLWLWRGKANWVLNFPTKVHWRNPSKMEWVEQGLEKFVAAYATQGITEISFPQLGCGNGNLEWNEVRPLMEHYLSKVAIPVYIHDYAVDVGLPEHLEPVAAAMREDGVRSSSFEAFLADIERAVDLSGGHLETLGTSSPFSARVREDHGLAIETSSATCLFEEDDLRGVWLDLQNGLVTERKAGWAARSAGAPLVSLLSVLPSVRPVQIQRPGQSEPEYAIEPRPELRGMATTAQSKQQHDFAWH
jgi:O-acetyl-ADP-ribose deacetylase (regulator of RNase III)